MSSGPLDGARPFHHWADELLLQQNSVPDGGTTHVSERTQQSQPLVSFLYNAGNQPNNQPLKEPTEGGDWCKRASRRPSVCLAIPALTAWLGSITDTLNYTITEIALTLKIYLRG
jgi:hypothetical protein